MELQEYIVTWFPIWFSRKLNQWKGLPGNEVKCLITTDQGEVETANFHVKDGKPFFGDYEAAKVKAWGICPFAYTESVL